MKKKYLLIGLFLLSILIFNIHSKIIITLGEDDDDGINDNFEENNKRNIEVDIKENEIGIESVRRSEENKDQIRVLILFNEDGLYIGLRYRSKLEVDNEIEFGILFQQLIEYNDTNENNLYDPEIDYKIKTVSLNDFKPVVYETSDISNNTSLHYLKIQTVDNLFTVHIFLAEEFVIIENSLITPTQALIEVDISNFKFEDEHSKLALYSKLDLEENYRKKEITEDEELGYGENERGIETTINDITGFFAWKNLASIDSFNEEVFGSELINNEVERPEIGFFMNYPYGEHIYHDNKIGIENILILLEEPGSPITIIILISVIGAASASAAYAIHYYVKKRRINIKLHKDRDAYLNEFFENDIDEEPYDGRQALQILKGENAIEKLSHVNNINITALSEDFFETLNLFDWESQERSEFILEMLALSPIERKLILEEMVEKSSPN